jgi:gamma-glutamylcysteine synthetase
LQVRLKRFLEMRGADGGPWRMICALPALKNPVHCMLQVRLKKFLEMRGADGGPWRMICALPALWVGLIYEPQAQAEALDLVASWSQDDRDYLRTG